MVVVVVVREMVEMVEEMVMVERGMLESVKWERRLRRWRQVCDEMLRV